MSFDSPSGDQNLEIATGSGGVDVEPSNEVLRVDPDATTGGIQIGRVSAVQTTDATVTTCRSLTLTSGDVYVIEAGGVAIVDSSGANQAGYKIVGTFQAGGGAATQVGATTVVHSAESAGAAAWDFAYDVTGLAVRVRVTGAAVTTINWACGLELIDR